MTLDALLDEMGVPADKLSRIRAAGALKRFLRQRQRVGWLRMELARMADSGRLREYGSHAEVAEALGVSRETVTKTLGRIGHGGRIHQP